MPFHQPGSCCGCGGGTPGCGGHLIVRVFNLADSSGVAGATVTLTSKPVGAANPTTSTTDSSGVWSYPMNVGGSYSWSVSYNGCSTTGFATVVCTADTTTDYYYCKGDVTVTVTDEGTGAPISGATLVVTESSGYVGFGSVLPAYTTDASGQSVISLCLMGAGPNCSGSPAYCVPATLCIGAKAVGYLSGPSAFFSFAGGQSIGGCAAVSWTCGDNATAAITLKPKVDPGGLVPVGVDANGAASCYPPLLDDAGTCPSGLSAASYRDWGYVPSTLTFTPDKGTNPNGAGDRTGPYAGAAAEMHCLWDYDNAGVTVTWDGVYCWDDASGNATYNSGCLAQTSGTFCQFTTPGAPIQSLQSAKVKVVLNPAGPSPHNTATFTNYWKADCTTDAGGVNCDCPALSGGVWKYGSCPIGFTATGCGGNPMLLSFNDINYGNTGTLTE